MLPTFPKSDKILNDEWHKQMFAAKDETFPLHMHPPVLHMVEGKTSDFQREDRKIEPTTMNHLQVQVEHKVEDDKGMTLEAYFAMAAKAGKDMGKKFWERTLQVVEAAVKETGNEVKISAGNLTQQNMLQMLEITQQNFDELGKPTSQFVCGSEFLEEIKKRNEEWKNDTEFQAKVEEIKVRKKVEFDEREARRRLVE